MSENQVNSSIVHMNIDNYAMGDNTSNIVNNYPSPPRQNENREDYDNQITIPNFPNQVQEALTIVKKFLARQSTNHEVKINKDGVFVNGKSFEVNYEPCRLCKIQPSSLICPERQRKICPKCVVKRVKKVKCLRCKNAKKNKDKLASEFEDKIERLLSLENNDKIKEMVLVEVENLAGKSLEELIEIVRKLELKKDKVDRSISIAYFYVGKIFYERMEEFFSESELTGKEKNRKILGSFKYAKELDFGVEKMSIIEIKEKLGTNDTNLPRFFSLTLKIFLVYKDFDSPEEQIRRAERVPSTFWLRELSQEKLLDFHEKVEQRRKENEE